MAAYLTAALEDDNPDVFPAAVGHVVKVRDMSAIAERASVDRQSLYKALAPGAKPRRHESQRDAEPRREAHRIGS